MSDTVLKLEHGIEIQDAMRRNKVTPADLKKMTSGTNLGRFRDVVRGKAKILYPSELKAKTERVFLRHDGEHDVLFSSGGRFMPQHYFNVYRKHFGQGFFERVVQHASDIINLPLFMRFGKFSVRSVEDDFIRDKQAIAELPERYAFSIDEACLLIYGMMRGYERDRSFGFSEKDSSVMYVSGLGGDIFHLGVGGRKFSVAPFDLDECGMGLDVCIFSRTA